MLINKAIGFIFEDDERFEANEMKVNNIYIYIMDSLQMKLVKRCKLYSMKLNTKQLENNL